MQKARTLRFQPMDDNPRPFPLGIYIIAGVVVWAVIIVTALEWML